jgi:pilus assembly protein Flp/PilA
MAPGPATVNSLPAIQRYEESRVHFVRLIAQWLRRADDEEGQTLVEYGLLLALIAIIIIVALIFLGPIISQLFQNVGTTLNNV